MLNFELCKKLKEVGFSQDWPDEWDDSQAQFYVKHLEESPFIAWVQQDEPRHDDGRIDDGETEILCKVPTLSELLEACGEKFSCLLRGEKCWWAQTEIPGTEEYDNGESIAGCGKTREEAVANLYLLITQPYNDKE